MILFEARASIILYNVLKSLKTTKTFLLPLNICPIVPAIFLKAKIPFELIDISSKNLCMDEIKIYSLLENKREYGGILFLKTFGVEFDAEYIYKKIRKINNNIFIIEDQCLSKPNVNFKINTTEADLVIFSTGYSKYVDLSWGGFGFLDDNFSYNSQNIPFKEEHLDDIVQSFQLSLNKNTKLIYKDTNWLGSNEILYKNFNDYFNEIQSKIIENTQHKNKLNHIYSSFLPEEIILGNNYNNWRFNIMVNNKKELLEIIFNNQLFASSHYASLEYMYNYIPNNKSSTSSKLHNNIINLFNDLRFKENDAIKITDIVNKFYQGT